MRKSVPRCGMLLDHQKENLIDDHKEIQTAVVWPYFPFIGSGQKRHLARRYCKKTEEDKADKGRGGNWSLMS